MHPTKSLTPIILLVPNYGRLKLMILVGIIINEL